MKFLTCQAVKVVTQMFYQVTRHKCTTNWSYSCSSEKATGIPKFSERPTVIVEDEDEDVAVGDDNKLDEQRCLDKYAKYVKQNLTDAGM